MKPKPFQAAAALIVLGALCHVTLLPAAEPKRGGSLKFAVDRSIPSLNPFVQGESIGHALRSLIYENLLAFDRNLEILPGLASSWNVSRDGMTYSFVLRPGVRFHNGKPLSPADIKWSIEYVQDPKNGADGRPELTVIQRIDLEPPDRIQIRLKSPYAAFLSSVASIHLFPIVAAGSVKPNERPEAFPAGTGPFRFVEWRPGQELRVQRFDGYWQKGLPYLDEIRFPVISDATVRMNAIRAGDLDIVARIPTEQIARIRDGKLPGLGVSLAAGGDHPRMGINHCRPPFNNLKVRQAFAYALNKQEIIDGAFSGIGTPTNQKLLRENQWFVSDLPDRKQDLAKARALLQEAGYPDGLKVTIPGSTGMENTLQVIQSQVKKVGIELTILIRDQVAHTAALRQGDFQISMSGGATSSDPDLAYYGYYYTPLPQERQLGGRTQPCYGNPRVDQLLDDARKTTDIRKRHQIYKEVIEVLQEDVADIPIAFVPRGYAFQNYVKEFSPTIMAAYSYGNGGLLKTWMDK